jgi:hypothetical protein
MQMMSVAPSPVSHLFHHANTARSAVTMLPPMRSLRRCSVGIAHHLLSTMAEMQANKHQLLFTAGPYNLDLAAVQERYSWREGLAWLQHPLEARDK